MIENIMKLLAGCITDGDSIEMPDTVTEEILILTNGGVTEAEFEEAVDIWIKFRTPVKNDYGFIRNMALTLAARRVKILLGADRG